MQVYTFGNFIPFTYYMIHVIIIMPTPKKYKCLLIPKSKTIYKYFERLSPDVFYRTFIGRISIINAKH